MKLEFEYPIEYLKMGFGIRPHTKKLFSFFSKNFKEDVYKIL